MNRFYTTARIIGSFCIAFAATLLMPIAVSAFYGDGELMSFVDSLVFSLVLGSLLLLLGRGRQRDLSTRDGFLVVGLFWIVLGLLAAMPLMSSLRMSMTDALFESVSALTTTGATVITGLDDLPPSVQMYRQWLQWLGGMGMIVLAIAVMPMNGVGGMNLYRAEAPGPLKDQKLTPRLAHTAQLLWMVYLGLTAANALAYWLAGMTPFDAIAHALSTVSTGGFSTHDASLGYFNSEAIETIAVVFMLFGAINFSVHFVALRHRDPLHYLRNVEVRSFLLFVVATVALVSLVLRSSGEYDSMPPSIRNAVFEVVSVVTSTGFGTVDFSHWPDILPILLIFISFVGGCGGSTAGGMKVMRIIVMLKQGGREIRRLIHPRAITHLRVGRQRVDDRTIDAVWGFMAAYVASFIVLMLLMIHFGGLGALDAFSAIATSMNNLGPGLGEVASNFTVVTDGGKLISVFAMLLGRLEVFTLLVLLTPGFWRA